VQSGSAVKTNCNAIAFFFQTAADVIRYLAIIFNQEDTHARFSSLAFGNTLLSGQPASLSQF
jgi:cadmium resistance protein CadD (predicted permease)